MTELLDIAERVVGWADDDEELEVVAVHDRETEVRVYEGQIESFTASESQGVGVRVIRDRKQGFAWAGTLDDAVLAWMALTYFQTSISGQVRQMQQPPGQVFGGMLFSGLMTPVEARKWITGFN